MFCSRCGYEMLPNMIFCPSCGQKAISDLKAVETKQQIFNWGLGMSNDFCIEEVNAWLSNKRISIIEVRTQGRLNCFSSKTILTHAEFKYKESEQGHFYQVGYFSKWKWIGHNFSGLDEQLETWKKNHPDKQVVLTTRNGHQAEGGNTMTLFFVYIDR